MPESDSDVEVEIVVQKQKSNKSILTPPKLNLELEKSTMATTTASTAATAVFTKNEIQLLMNAIPEYSPGANLSVFLTEVDNLVIHLDNRLSPDLTYILNFSIRSKIKGEARDFIAHHGATLWSDIRKALLQKYGDQRNEEILVSELTHCVQKKTETFMDYYARLLKIFNDLMQNISLNITDPNLLSFKKLEYPKLALRTFQIGIIEPYRSFLSHFKLSTIEECISKCNHLDNRQHEYDYCEFLRKAQEETPKKSPFLLPEIKPNPVIHQKPIFPTAPLFKTQPIQPTFRPQFPQPNFRPPFQPPQPFNRPAWQAPKTPFQFPTQPPRFQPFTQRPAFGFGKPNLPNNSQPSPTPMSVQSRVRTNQFRQNRPWQNNNNPRPLFNLQPEDYQPDYDYDYNYDPDNSTHDNDTFSYYASEDGQFSEQNLTEEQIAEQDVNFPIQASAAEKT